MSKIENIIYGSMKNKITATDLIRERSNKDFDAEKGDGLVSVLDKPYITRFREACDFVQNDP
jgi:hypothetical protein